MLYVGVDPGGTIGLVVYCPTQRRVLMAGEYTDPTDALRALRLGGLAEAVQADGVRLAIEGVGLYRTDTTRPGGNVVGESVFATARQVGWFSAMFAMPPSGHHVMGNSIVRNLLVGHLPAKMRGERVVNQWLRDQHGGEDSTRKALEPVEATWRKDGSPWRKAAPGRAQGALVGVVGHSWNALACAVAAAKRDGVWEAK